MATAAEGSGARPGGIVHRASAALHRHRGIQLGLTIGPPLAWMLVVYLAALALLFATSFWSIDPFTSSIVHTWDLHNYREILTEPTYRIITFRTIAIAIAVTLTDI